MPQRDSHLDNAKGLLMILVLAGHLVWPVPNPDTATNTLYVFVYLFHMPLFALISGFLSHAEFDAARLGREAGRLLAPYLLFVLVQYLLMRGLGQTPFPLTEGHFGLWFLLSLFCWRAMLPFFALLPAATALLLALLVALGCGYVGWIGLGFSLSRTLVLFPCFLAGHLLKRRGEPLSSLCSPLPGGLVLLGLAALALPLAARNIHLILYSAYPYAASGLDPAWGPVVRLARLGLALAGGLALLAATPRRRCLLTSLGKNSLTIYLVHGLLLVLYRAWPALHDPAGRLCYVIVPLAAALAWLLSRRTTVRIARPLTAPLSLAGSQNRKAGP